MMIDKIIHLIPAAIRRYKFDRSFKSKFPDSYITPVNQFNLNSVEIGKRSYGPLDIHSFGPGMDGLQVKIGSYVSIAAGVKFLVKMEHQLHTFSTYPFNHYILHEPEYAGSKGPIIVGDDVWIGDSAIIMSGVTIGQGAVIAAGAVVTKDVDPYAIVGGVPAKLIKYRHSKDIREKLLKIDYSQISDDIIINNKEVLYKKIDDSNIDDILNLFPHLK